MSTLLADANVSDCTRGMNNHDGRRCEGNSTTKSLFYMTMKVMSWLRIITCVLKFLKCAFKYT